MIKNKPTWQIILIILAIVGIGYYVIKTFVLEELSNTLDAIIFMSSCVILAVFAYFSKRVNKSDK